MLKHYKDTSYSKKKNNKTEFGNYKPILIFSNFSQIFKRLIYNRTLSFLDKYFIILPTHNSSFNINENKNTTLILLDLKRLLIQQIMKFYQVNFTILVLEEMFTNFSLFFSAIDSSL